MKLSHYFVCFSVIVALFFSACKKDQLLTDSSAKLAFSTDSVLFDTVFTSLGSTTKTFRIYNKHSQPLNISRIALAMGGASPFKLNVDGVAGKSISDVEIAGGDSLFVFVQVTVDPTNASSPMLIKDSILFETNGNTQNVKLVAVGQNVYIHKPDHFVTGLPAYSIIGRENHDTILPNDKPHLFFGYSVIDSHCKLTMQAGTKCYFYNNAVLWVYDQGTLIVNGAHGNEVTFQGLRLESDYRDVPGQWGKIWLSKGSVDNVINWAVIRNGGIGIQADSCSNTNPTVIVTNTIIKNMTAAAIFGQTARVRGVNCVFANCGQYVAALTLGGNYNFQQCTFADYWVGSGSGSSSTARTTPLLAMNNYYTSGSTLFLRPLDSCYFANCIFYGDQSEEVGIDSTTLAGAGFFSYEFDHCLIRTQRNISNGHYSVCLQNQDPQFKDTGENNYELKTTSPAINAGNTSIVIPQDLNDHTRDSQSDIGAYEFY